MKLLINDKEITHFLCSIISNNSSVKDITINEKETAEAINWVLEKKNNSKSAEGVKKWLKKSKDKILRGVESDTRDYVNNIKTLLKNQYAYNFNYIHKNLDYFVDKLGEEQIFSAYKKSSRKYFIKSVGIALDPTSELIRRKQFNDFSEDCLFRNMDGNEQMLLTKMNNNWDFWFIDTGYTNFLHDKNKVWHRLVRNNLHHSNMIDVPTNRLGIFESFPQPWRTGGDKILIIEPGHFCAKTFGIDIEQWKKDVISEIRQHTDKQIVIRQKLTKKGRPNLYKELCNEDYYCVININSNAATESIWAGIPAITLQRHITNPITKNSISDINNLYRGNIANWLCTVSYSQFTYDELIDGTASRLVKKYHG